MNERTTKPAWIPAMVLALALAPGTLAHSIRLEVAPSSAMVLSGSAQRAHIRVALTGLATNVDRRAPINVAIVLDRSGSMAGEKIEEAKRAAIAAVQRLRADDIVSIVTYESTVDVLVPATRLTDKPSVIAAIERIGTAGNTALFAGVSKGAAELRKFLDRNRVNTMILLSDGLANVGPSSPGELAGLGAALAREGMAVSTIGLGLQYNEDLMTRLALASDGNHFFVEDEGDLELAFATEFGDALSVVAQGVRIYIHCPEGIRPIRVLGREARISGQVVEASLNQMFRDQTRYLLLEVELPPDVRPGQDLPVASVDVTYHDLIDTTAKRLTGTARVTLTASPEVAEESVNRDVAVAVVQQIANETNELAMALRDQGKIEEARGVYLGNVVYLEENAKRFDADALQKDALSNRDASTKLKEGDWSRERKKQQEQQLKLRSQRSIVDKKDTPKPEPKDKD